MIRIQAWVMYVSTVLLFLGIVQFTAAAPTPDCVTMPPGHLIAPGQIKKNGATTSPPCQQLPPGIAKKVAPNITVEPVSSYARPTHFEKNDYRLAEFQLRFKVTATNDDIYLDERFLFDQNSSLPLKGGARLAVEDRNGQVLGGGAEGYQMTGDSGAVQVANNEIKILKGTSGIITIHLYGFEGGTEGRLVLYGLEWRPGSESVKRVYAERMGPQGKFVTSFQFFDSELTYAANHPAMNVQLVSTSAGTTSNASGTVDAQYAIRFRINALGGDVYIPKKIDPGIQVSRSGTTSPLSLMPTLTALGGTELTHTFRVASGTSVDFIESVTWPNATGTSRGLLPWYWTGMPWGVIDTASSTNRYYLDVPYWTDWITI